MSTYPPTKTEIQQPELDEIDILINTIDPEKAKCSGCGIWFDVEENYRSIYGFYCPDCRPYYRYGTAIGSLGSFATGPVISPLPNRGSFSLGSSSTAGMSGCFALGTNVTASSNGGLFSQGTSLTKPQGGKFIPSPPKTTYTFAQPPRQPIPQKETSNWLKVKQSLKSAFRNSNWTAVRRSLTR